jgi:hypothetical protein
MLFIYIKRLKIEIVAAIAIVVILSLVLMLRPITGIADNGDFARIMNSTGLSTLSDLREDRYFGYVNRLYNTSYIIPFGGRYLSTQIPLVVLAVYISKALSGALLFDIRTLGAIYTLILAAAVFLTIRCIRKRSGYVSVFSALVLLLILCDIGYTAYFNSLYGEPVTFTFLLLMAGTALTLATAEKPAVWMLLLFGTAALFFSGAKVQNGPSGLLAALLCIRLVWLRKDTIWRSIAMVSAAAVVFVSLSCYLGVSKEIKVCNKYQSVFYGILKNSPDPAGDLQELGLDPSLAPLAGTNYFMESYPIDIRTPEFKKMIYENINYTKVAGFYLKHPSRFLQKLEFAAANGFQLKQGFGNFEKYPGINYKQTTNSMGFWSDFKMKVLPHTLFFIGAFYVVVFLALVYEYGRADNPGKRFLVEFFGFIAITGAMQLILPIIADGEADISKHLFLFDVSFDMLFVSGLTYAVLKAMAVVRYFRGRRLAAKLQTE